MPFLPLTKTSSCLLSLSRYNVKFIHAHSFTRGGFNPSKKMPSLPVFDLCAKNILNLCFMTSMTLIKCFYHYFSLENKTYLFAIYIYLLQPLTNRIYIYVLKIYWFCILLRFRYNQLHVNI